jgi:RNA polymerase sigma-70 factor (ECF subfamily)
MELSEANCRQLYRRAAQHLADHKPRFQPSREDRERLAARFLAAAQNGDLRALEALLAEDITSWADSDGRHPVARTPVSGRERVARYFAGAWRKAPDGIAFTFAEVNGGTALVATVAGVPLGVVALDIDGERIAAVRIIANPAKLSHIGSLAGS